MPRALGLGTSFRRAIDCASVVLGFVLLLGGLERVTSDAFMKLSLQISELILLFASLLAAGFLPETFPNALVGPVFARPNLPQQKV